MATAVCARCKATVPADNTDITLDGIVCRACQIAAAGDDKELTKLERQLRVSSGTREVIVGVFLLVLGGALLALGASVGIIAAMPIFVVGAGIYAIVRGVTRLAG